MTELASTDPLHAVAVVTVSYNSSGELGDFLSSIARSEHLAVPVTIADNLSADFDEVDRIGREHGATVLSLGQNLGYGGAINAAVKSLPESIEFVLVSNPDVMVHPAAISTLVTALLSNPRIAAVGPKVLNPDGSIYPSARRLPSLRTGIGHALFSRVWPNNPWTRSYRAESEPTEAIRAVGWLSGSCLLVRRSAFESIGGFDDDYFMYFEDVDFGYRVGKGGWINMYIPQASVTHTGAASTSMESARMVVAHHDSAFKYLSRKYSAWYLAPLRSALRVALSVRAWWVTR